MKVMKKFGLLILLVVMMLFVQSASAVTMLILPASSSWQGELVHKDQGDGLDVLVQYAVYDRDNLDSINAPDEYAFVNSLDMTGQYIYAYQLFNAEESSDIGFFEVLNLDKSSIDEASINDDTGSVDDGSSGVEPDSIPSEGAWGFSEGTFLSFAHSQFLIFSSAYAPIEGTYKFETPDPTILIPDGVPEPGTIILLGLGGISLLRKRKPV